MFFFTFLRYFNLEKNIRFEAIQNGTKSEFSRLEQRTVIIFLVAEMCKAYEIYRRMCDVYEEVCFSPKTFYNWEKRGLGTMSLS